ncbi:MAG: hypothetical protein IJ867_02005, partial [Clostridia bacterium]|nr:hypothetical protein [Clostridia bacterium]
MYERNAIVLERYFYEIFGFKNSSNLRENYYNYRRLFDCYGELCRAKEREEQCQKEFDETSNEITRLQKMQEKLYNRSAKYEYSRYIIFCNVEEGQEAIEKHLNQVEEDVQRNNDELKELGENFVQTIADFAVKQANLKEATWTRENAQAAYDEAYEIAQKCYEGITEEQQEFAKKFIGLDNKENKKELQEIFEDNGKNERNQFDPDVINNTINKSIEIYKIEMDIYLVGFDRISKLFEEIESDSVKTDKHMKYYRDSKAKLDFLGAEKEYIVQFLDNERIGAIYDKKAHRKLMLEACKKFVLDFEQIEKLYDIIIKEAAGRSTKKIYKENYNKEYLLDLEEASVEPSLDTGKMRQDAIAFVNLNYWRIEGMKSVYSIFEDVVTTIYEKDLTEFMPEEVKEPEVQEVSEVQEVETVQEIPETQEVELVQEISEIEKVEVTQEVEPVQDMPEVTEVEEIQEVQKVAEVEAVQEIQEEEPVEEIEQKVLEAEEEQEIELEESDELEIEEIPEIEEEQEFVEDIQEEVIEEQVEQEPENIEEEMLEQEPEEIEQEEEDIAEAIEEPVQEEAYVPRKIVYYSSKMALANAIY